MTCTEQILLFHTNTHTPHSASLQNQVWSMCAEEKNEKRTGPLGGRTCSPARPGTVSTTTGSLRFRRSNVGPDGALTLTLAHAVRGGGLHHQTSKVTSAEGKPSEPVDPAIGEKTECGGGFRDNRSWDGGGSFSISATIIVNTSFFWNRPRKITEITANNNKTTTIAPG